MSLFFSFLFLASLFWYLLSVFFKRNDIADIAWGSNAVFLALLAWGVSGVSLFSPQGIALLLILFWGMRLSFHITSRILKKDEDPRYAKYRKEWGALFPLKSYLFIFLGQTLLIALITITPWYILSYGQYFSWNIIAVLGVGIWVLGFSFESIADNQLKNFLHNPKNKGKLMTEGLWKYSRHPNYFGESVMWWGLFLVTISFPYGWIALVSPVIITFFLLKVTGIPLAEKSLSSHPDFSGYKKKTSIFIPLPPRK